jgi:hypothetical protein
MRVGQPLRPDEIADRESATSRTSTTATDASSRHPRPNVTVLKLFFLAEKIPDAAQHASPRAGIVRQSFDGGDRVRILSRGKSPESPSEKSEVPAEKFGFSRRNIAKVPVVASPYHEEIHPTSTAPLGNAAAGCL